MGAELESPMWTRRPGTPLFDFYYHSYGCVVVQTNSENWCYWEQQGFFEAVELEKFDTLMTYTCAIEGYRGGYNLKLYWEELKNDRFLS